MKTSDISKEKSRVKARNPGQVQANIVVLMASWVEKPYFINPICKYANYMANANVNLSGPWELSAGQWATLGLAVVWIHAERKRKGGRTAQ